MKHSIPNNEHPEDQIEAILLLPEAEDRRRPGLWQKIGGGSLTVSVMVHGVFVIIALLLIWRTVQEPDSVPENFMTGGDRGDRLGEKLAAQQRRAVSHAQPARRVVAPNGSGFTLPNTSAMLVSMPAQQSLLMGGGGTGTGSQGGDQGGIGKNFGGKPGRGSGPGDLPGHVSMPPQFRGRCSPAERAQKLKANGGSDLSEAAVKQSLKWLRDTQNKDGSWGESHKGGMTGLALLAYLGHCETPESPAYGETVLKGLTYLMELGVKNKPPFDGVFSEKPATNSSTYEHGIATYALGEMYSFAKLGTKPIPGLRESFERGAAVIIEKQNPHGSWGYKDGIGYDPYGRDDLSVTGWQFQALKAAGHTGLKIAGLTTAVRKVERYLESTQTADGGFGNPDQNQHYNQWNLTGAALLGLQTLGSGNAGIVNKGTRWLVDQTEKVPLDWNRDCYIYTWYYNTQALFQKGGAPWKMWNDQFQRLLIENQNADGSYKVEGAGPVGAAGTAAAGGDANVYRTCLSTLMLEVYYRYLKVGDRGSDSSSNLLPPK